jgi:dihydroorotate dehydrogenase (fumarate)
MRTKTKIAGIALDSFVFNASGINDSNTEELEELGKSGSSAVLMKSCTIEARQGNPEPRYSRLEKGSIQCMGLPNRGYKYYMESINHLKRYNKPTIASIAGTSSQEYKTMLDEFNETQVDLIEINLSCPNLEASVIAYDLEQTKEILSSLKNSIKKPTGLKLPAFLDQSQIKKMAEVIKDYDIKFLTCINSISNSLIIDFEKESPILKPKKGYGALCGQYIKPMALGNVRSFYEFLPNIDIIGVGGIETGKDTFEFLLCGASAVQVGTCFEKEGPNCFKRIDDELEEILKMKGYNSIEEAKGKLKFL